MGAGNPELRSGASNWRTPVPAIWRAGQQVSGRSQHRKRLIRSRRHLANDLRTDQMEMESRWR